MLLQKIKNFILAIESWLISLILNLNSVKYGKGFRIKGCPYLRIKGVFNIGNNVRINSRISANPIGGNIRCYFVVAPGAKLRIGNGVAISNCAINCYESIIIEDNVMIGGNCKIYDTDFHSLNTDQRVLDDRSHITTKPIHIKQNAFIGGHVIILKGVTIGQNSIIGAGSVVTKDIPDNEIWAGNPAKFIKTIE